MTQKSITMRVDLADATSQQILVEVSGEDVLNIETQARPGTDPDEIMPDWLELIADAVNLGMMSGAALQPSASRAALTNREFDASAARNRWYLSLEHTDPGAFRVIYNLLRARRLDSISLQSLSAPPGAPRLEMSRLAYPGRHGHLPFAIHQEQPLRTSRDRGLQIVFEQAPPEDFRQAALRALDVWGNLLILAAYAAPDRDPREACTLPDFPYWLDEVTLAQPFEEFFDSDPDCFNAMVGWAARVHGVGTRVATVFIR